MGYVVAFVVRLIVFCLLATTLTLGVFVTAARIGTQISIIWDGLASINDYTLLIAATGLTVALIALSKKLHFKSIQIPAFPFLNTNHAKNEKGKSMGMFDKKRALIKDLTEEDIQAYFGDESVKYSKVKKSIDRRQNIYWSWWAFIFGGIWTGYNKWWYGVFISIVVWFLNGWVGAVALNVVLGLYGQFLYLASAAKQIKDIKETSETENEMRVRMRKKGKPSLWIAILTVLFLNMAMWFGGLIYQSSTQSTLSFNYNAEKVTSPSEVADKGVRVEGKIIDYQTDPVFVLQWPFEDYVSCIDESKYDVSFRKSIFNPIVMDIADKQGNKLGYIAFAESKRPNHYVIVNSDVSQIDNYTEKMNLAEGIARLGNERIPSYVRNFIIMQMPFKDNPDC